MVWEMAFADFRMRDQGTFLGFIWTLLHPLVYFAVLYTLFVDWMGSGIPDFPLYLIIGFVQWNFFATGTSTAIFTIVRYGSYIRSINFPKSVLVVASVLSVLFSHFLELVVLLVFWLLVKGHVGIVALLLLPILCLNIFLVLSIAFFLATVGVYFLDISRIWGICMSIGLFLTPIFYSLDMLSPFKRNVILLNPMTHVIQASRNILIDNHTPQFGGLGYVFLFSLVMFVIGYWMFKAHEGYFVERI